MNKENNITIQKINSLEKIDSIKEDWIQFQQKYNGENIYTDPDFFVRMFATRAAKGSNVNIVIFKKNEKIIAMIIGWINPNYFTTCWMGYFKMKSPCMVCFEIENNGIIIDDSKETQNIVCNYLKSMKKNREVEVFLFNHLSSTNPMWKKIFKENNLNKKLVYKKSVNWQTLLIDSETGKKKPVHSKRTMQKLNRKGKKFLSSFDDDVEIKNIENENEIDNFLKESDHITKNSYQYSLNVGVRNDKYWKQTLTDMAKGKYLRAYMLYVKGKPVAYSMGAFYQKILFLFATTYDFKYQEHSPGEYLRYQLIEILADSGVKTIDYGFGDAIYKQRCGNVSFEEASIKIYGKGAQAFITSKMDYFLTYTLEKVLDKMRKFKIFDNIKSHWREVLLKKTAVY